MITDVTINNNHTYNALINAYMSLVTYCEPCSFLTNLYYKVLYIKHYQLLFSVI